MPSRRLANAGISVVASPLAKARAEAAQAGAHPYPEMRALR
ncbi:hypothetical protein [Nonomuraea sp. NPDC050786]